MLVGPGAGVRQDIDADICRRIADDLRLHLRHEGMRGVVCRRLFFAGVVCRLEIALRQREPKRLCLAEVFFAPAVRAGDIDGQVADIPHRKFAPKACIFVEVDGELIQIRRAGVAGVARSGIEVLDIGVFVDVQHRLAVLHLEVLCLRAGRAAVEVEDGGPVKGRRDGLVGDRDVFVAAHAEVDAVEEGHGGLLVADVACIGSGKAQRHMLCRGVVRLRILRAGNIVTVAKCLQPRAEGDIVPVADDDQRLVIPLVGVILRACGMVEQNGLKLSRTAERKDGAVLQVDKAGGETGKRAVGREGDLLFVGRQGDIVGDLIAVEEHDLAAGFVHSADGCREALERRIRAVAAVCIFADRGTLAAARGVDIVNIERRHGDAGFDGGVTAGADIIESAACRRELVAGVRMRVQCRLARAELLVAVLAENLFGALGRAGRRRYCLVFQRALRVAAHAADRAV